MERWRTGFYHIAHTAGVPIVPAALDWEAHTVRLLPPFITTGAADADIAAIQQRFSAALPRSAD